MKKKLLALTLAALMALSLAACGSSSAGSASSAAASASGSAAASYTIGICQLVQHAALDTAVKMAEK